jgi:hypothetical protein
MSKKRFSEIINGVCNILMLLIVFLEEAGV